MKTFTFPAEDPPLSLLCPLLFRISNRNQNFQISKAVEALGVMQSMAAPLHRRFSFDDVEACTPTATSTPLDRKTEDMTDNASAGSEEGRGRQRQRQGRERGGMQRYQHQYQAYSPLSSSSSPSAEVHGNTSPINPPPPQQQRPLPQSPLPSGRIALGDLPYSQFHKQIQRHPAMVTPGALRREVQRCGVSAPLTKTTTTAGDDGDSGRRKQAEGKGKKKQVRIAERAEVIGEEERTDFDAQQQPERHREDGHPREEALPPPTHMSEIIANGNDIPTPPPPQHTISSFNHPDPHVPKNGFKLLSREDIAARKSSEKERLVNADDEGDSEEGGTKTMKKRTRVGCWRQKWWKWMLVFLVWGVLCMVVGGAVGLAMR